MTKRLLFTAPMGGHVWRGMFNTDQWKPALVAAGVIAKRERGQETYASAREHAMHALWHFYASVLLDAGKNVKALAGHLGHADPGLTLRVYAHLMPSSRDGTRTAVSAVYRTGISERHG